MLILYTLLVASISLSSLADASAIKGHARTAEELRSIKLVPVGNNLDKVAKVVAPLQAQAQQAPVVAVFESTKRIYNDESIRRLASAQQPLSYPSVAEQVHQAAPAKSAEPAKAVPVEQAKSALVEPAKIAPVEPLKSAPQEPIVAVPVQQAPVAPAKSVEQVGPVAVAIPVQPVVVQKAPESIKEVAAPVEAKSGAIVAAKPADDLPPQTDRSAPIHNEAPVAAQTAPVAVEQPAPVSVVKVEQPAVAPVASQPELVVPVAPVAPVVPVALVVPAAPAAPVVAEVAAVPVAPVAQSPAEPAKESALQARKDEAPAVAAASSAPVEPLIEVPAPDPGLVLSEPIDSTTKLLIDLDEHMQKFLPNEDKQEAAKPEQSSAAGNDHSPSSSVPTGKSAPLKPYSSSVADEPIVPPLPSLEGVEKASAGSASPPASAPAAAVPTSHSSSSSAQAPSATRQGGHQHQNQQQVITQLLDQLDTLHNRIQDTINQLVARRRYVMSALLRPMGTYVRRVRTNLERLQNRVNQLQAAAVSVGGGGSRPGGFVDAAAIETIRRRIDDISKRISDIVNRIRFSLTPTSAPLNSNGRK